MQHGQVSVARGAGRSALAAALALAIAVVVLVLAPAVAFADSETSEPTTSEPTTSEPTTSEPTTSEPTTTVNEFLPTDRDLTDCLSALPRPGCGSEARGGWRQATVFGVMVIGLGVIGTRVVMGLRRRPD